MSKGTRHGKKTEVHTHQVQKMWNTFHKTKSGALVVDTVRPPSSESTGGAKETALWEVSNPHERAKSSPSSGAVADVRYHRNFGSSRFPSGPITL